MADCCSIRALTLVTVAKVFLAIELTLARLASQHDLEVFNLGCLTS